MSKDENVNVDEVSDPSIANQDLPSKKKEASVSAEPNSTKQRALAFPQ